MATPRNLVKEAQASLASYSPDKLGALCFLAPLTSPLIVQSFSTLVNLYHHLYHHPLFNLTPSFAFLLLTLSLMLIVTSSIRSHPQKNKSILATLLHFPFRPMEMTCFTHNDILTQGMHGMPSLLETKPLIPKSTRFLTAKHSILPRSVSYQDLATLSPKSPLTKAPSLSRSSSHNTYLNLKSTPSPPLPILEDLTDDEANKRFSAFIESRLATMKTEVLE